MLGHPVRRMDRVTTAVGEAPTSTEALLPNLVEAEDLKVHFPIRSGLIQKQIGTEIGRASCRERVWIPV